jgi:cytochrome c peroxidase
MRTSLSALALLLAGTPAFAQPPREPEPADFLLPDESKMTPFKDRVPMVFVTSNQPEWKSLKDFWTGGTHEAVDPATGQKVTQKVVKIKVPLGLTQPPPVPAENPMTVE